MGRRRLYPRDPRTGTTDAARQAACRQRKRQAARAQRQAWATPPDLFAQLDAEFHFTRDVAAQPGNALCARFYTPAQDGLAQSWAGDVCWCNPPYREVGRWVRKAAEAAQAGATVVCLLPASTDTQWWHTWVMPLAEIRFLQGRLKFSGSTTNAPFPCAVVIFRPAGGTRGVVAVPEGPASA
jgi:phage N-6-adenine-methyltransferase